MATIDPKRYRCEFVKEVSATSPTEALQIFEREFGNMMKGLTLPSSTQHTTLHNNFGSLSIYKQSGNRYIPKSEYGDPT